MLPLEELRHVIRRQRLILGLTQQQLAEAAAVSQSLVAKLEKGRLNPSYHAVRAIVVALEHAADQSEPTAAELMQQEPAAASPDEPLGAALMRMKREGFSQMPVVDGGVPVGSLSERAILARIENGADIDRLKEGAVRAVMGNGFPTVALDTGRRVLVEMLRERDAVLVVENGRLRGLVTKSDLW